MSELSPYISRLLLEHDCVIIPNFGGFVANPHPAKINRLKAQIDPPYKEIGFNPRLTKNDGLLANHLRDESSISYEKALERIAAEVADIQAQLKSGKTYRMPGIGSFYMDHYQSLRFSAEQGVAFDLDFFGFEPVLAQSFETAIAPETIKKSEVPAFTEEAETEETPVIDFEERKEKTNWKNVAIAVACIPFLLYLLWVPVRVDFNDYQDFQLSDFNPYVEAPCAIYEARTYQPEAINLDKSERNVFQELAKSNENYVTTSFFEVDNPNYNKDELVTVELRNFPAAAITTKVAPQAYVQNYQLKQFYVVGGCFREYNNANNFIYKLRSQGFNAVLIDKKGSLFRVGVEGANTLDEVVLQLDAVRAKGYSDAWVLRK